MDLRNFVGVFTLLGVVALIKGQGFKPAGQIPEHCFDCICEASTECNEDIGCTIDGPNQYTCGPYAISYQYWKEGGSPGQNPDDPLDFERCLTSKPCAEATIKGYMQQWGQDCNLDGYIDCKDWAMLHKAGPNACNGTWIQKSDYWARFTACHVKETGK